MSEKYTVYVDDNYHYMDEGERIAAELCQGIIDNNYGVTGDP